MERKKRLVAGVGINDSTYPVIEMIKTDEGWKKGKRCPYYQVWQSLISRCYGTGAGLLNPSYESVTVCEDWKTFSKFKAWMEVQDWEGKYLDKDLINPESKVYSPDTCVFVDRKINNFLSLSSKGDLLCGVAQDKKSPNFISQCHNGEGKQVRSFGFKSEMDAHLFWIKSKLELAKKYEVEYNGSNVEQGLKRVVNKLTYHLENKLVVNYI